MSPQWQQQTDRNTLHITLQQLCCVVMQMKHNPAGEQLISGHHTMTLTAAAYR